MISVTEATRIIQQVSAPHAITLVPLAEAVNRVLAEAVLADRDLPPFNRVAMDGIAIRSASFGTYKSYQVEGIQPAGAVAKVLLDESHCLEVMTGAVLPEGTDAVVRYEDIEIKDGVATIQLQAVTAGMNVHHQGSDARQDDVLLTEGQHISPAEVALLASVGKAEVKVYGFPRTAIISSGDELVDIDAAPQAHQIRRSNAYALQAAMREMGWQASAFHLNDTREEVLHELQLLMQDYDVLILSGGVSKGKFDFIPDALTELGVTKLFHQVSQRPGKPFWFGTVENKVVFALPGNPVSTFLCFYRYIKPWMQHSMGVKSAEQTAILTSSTEFKPPLTYFLQVHAEHENGKLIATPIPGGGSGDFANLKAVNGFLELPADRSAFQAGEVFPFIPFR
ncbi:MAG: molybdopterin molybdotransferase MoeA [Cyclobacteriaceae bacterium]|nr:molybdopterin molybdotransferase MoeA [Cyclobacteriaceae bacterium]